MPLYFPYCWQKYILLSILKLLLTEVFSGNKSCVQWQTLSGVFNFSAIKFLPSFSKLVLFYRPPKIELWRHYDKINQWTGGCITRPWLKIAFALITWNPVKHWKSLLFLIHPTYKPWRKVIGILWLHICVMWCGLLQPCFALTLKFTQAPGHGL